MARSVAPAPKISKGIASGSTISATNTLLRRKPTVSPAPIAPNQLNVNVPMVKLAIIVANAKPGMFKAIATSGEINTSAAPLTSQCAQVLALTMTARP